MKDCLRLQMKRQEEEGFMLVGLIVAIFIILLVLGVAAPKVSQELKREREVETIHRGDQYVRAIRVFYRKNGSMFPGSIEQLEKTNNVRFLRQRYLDPMTGKSDWKLIHVGEAKTTVKGFFGQPLSGMAPGLGSAAGAASPTQGSTLGSSPTGSSGFGSSSFGSGGYGSSSGSSGFGSSSSGSSAFGSSGSGSSGMPTLGGSSSTSGTGTSGTGTSGSGSSTPSTLGSASGIASNQSGSGMPGGGGPFVGVGLPKEGSSITILNEQTTYNTWEFLYDPRIEQLYAKGALLGGGATGLGSAAGNSSGFGGAAPASGYGSSPSSGFGSSPSSGFGSSPGSGFGSSPTTPPTTPPQQPQ
jgi:type II secretory pathway pseudopilin PulG